MLYQVDVGENISRIKKTLRRIAVKTADEVLEEARKLDKFQKKALHVGSTWLVKSDWKQGEDVGEQLEDVLFLLLGMIDAVPV